MQYKNTKTGVVLTTECKVNGGDWEPLVPSSPKTVKKVEKTKPVKKEVK